MKRPSPKFIKNYCRDHDLPLGSYAAMVGIYNLLLGGVLWKTSRDKKDDGRLPASDLLLMSLSTHKLSRTITKDAVTAPFRAPFTCYKEDLGYGEVNESPRGRGLQQAVGELLSCNYCADMWVGLGLLFGLKTYPRQTRFLMSLFSSVAAADLLHVVYENNRTQENVLTLEEEELESRNRLRKA
jgi:hypothetical protein